MKMYTRPTVDVISINLISLLAWIVLPLFLVLLIVGTWLIAKGRRRDLTDGRPDKGE